MQMQGFPYIKQLLEVGVVLSKERGGCGAAQEAMIAPRDPGAVALRSGVDVPDHRKWGKIPQKEEG